MDLTLLKAKLHRAVVTHAEVDYEGSCAIDSTLLEAAGIREYEQIHIYNVANGERFVTYAIRAEAGSGIVSVNGAAAHRASPGDAVIICAYAVLSEAEADRFQPTLVYFDTERGDNRPTQIKHAIPVQAA
ncbi:MAG: aspartate 1-decarboxylase [Pseudomonadota bacterium]